MARSQRVLDRFTFGGRLPYGVGLVIAVTVVLSVIVALGNHRTPLFEYAALEPARVYEGQVWRLVTWPFVQPGPLKLLFACLFLYWFGRDLADVWGSRRFLAVYGGVVAVAGIGTCLVALVYPSARDHVHLGDYAIAAAMTVAWGLWFPDRVIRIYFVIPLRGYLLAWLTVIVTVLFAIYLGWGAFLPELFAEGAMLAYLFRRTIRQRVGKVQADFAAGRREAARRSRTKSAAAYLRVIEGGDAADAPMPKELQGRVDDLLSRKRKPEDLN